MESTGTEGDLSVRPEGEEEAESSQGRDQENANEFRGADQLVSYIIPFANTVELYQKKNQNCFRYGSPNHLVKDCPKDLSKVARKVNLNIKEGMKKKGNWTPQKPVVSQQASPDKAPRA